MNKEVVQQIAQLLIDSDTDVEDFIWESEEIIDKMNELKYSYCLLNELTEQAQSLNMGYN